MRDDDIGIIMNHLHDEFDKYPNGKASANSLRSMIVNADFKYVMETFDNLLIGFYAYNLPTTSIAELAIFFVAKGYRKTKYAVELWKHGTEQLHTYSMVKCDISRDPSIMPKKYYNKYRKILDIKKLYKRLK